MSQVDFQQLTDYANAAIARLNLEKVDPTHSGEITIFEVMTMGDNEFPNPEEYVANFHKRFELTCDEFMAKILDKSTLGQLLKQNGVIRQNGQYTTIAITASYDMRDQSTHVIFNARCPEIGTVRIL